MKPLTRLCDSEESVSCPFKSGLGCGAQVRQTKPQVVLGGPLWASARDGAGGPAASQLPRRPKVPGSRSQLDFEGTSEWFWVHKPWTPQAHPPLQARYLRQPWGLRGGLVCLPKVQRQAELHFPLLISLPCPFVEDTWYGGELG